MRTMSLNVAPFSPAPTSRNVPETENAEPFARVPSVVVSAGHVAAQIAAGFEVALSRMSARNVPRTLRSASVRSQNVAFVRPGSPVMSLTYRTGNDVRSSGTPSASLSKTVLSRSPPTSGSHARLETCVHWSHQPPDGAVMSFQVSEPRRNDSSETFSSGEPARFRSASARANVLHPVGGEVALPLLAHRGSSSDSVLMSPSTAYGSVKSWNSVTLCGGVAA